MMLFVWVTPQRCGRKVDRTLCLCIYGKECRIDRTLYSTLLIFLVWSTGPLLIIFGRPDGKLFLSFLLILLCFNKTISLLPLVVVDVVVVVDEVVLVVVAEQC